MAEVSGKVMSAKEAVDRFVHNGDELVIGNYTVGSCAELVYEIARQRKKGFTLYSQSGIFDVEVLVAGGCVDRLVTTYVMRSGGKKRRFRRRAGAECRNAGNRRLYQF